MTTRQKIVKTVLWALLGIFLTVSVVRFVNGLGVTTALSDAAPWGLWIAFDVMAGVALAAGGFVLAATVYIFRLERFRPFVRPAILTAFLGYVAVVVGLLFDIGLPWNIWHPMVYPQVHSVLFEVAMCVMLYLTVLSLEFAPVALEHPLFDRPFFRSVHRVLKTLTIPLVIAGIVLSTLHQSSLGSLFLITPYRLHPLWYSPYIYVLFLVSAIGLGLMMVTLESLFSAWFYGHEVRTDLLSNLGKAAAAVLALYVVLRLGDLGVRGQLGYAFDGTFLGNLFLFELILSAVLPALLLTVPRVRRSTTGLAIASLMTVFGVVGYRFNVAVVAFQRPPGASYFPAWTEIAVSAGIVATALLVFLFFVEHLRVLSEHTTAPPPRPRFNPSAQWSLLPDSLAAPRRHSLALVAGVAAALAFLPSDALFGAQPQAVPTSRPRTVDGLIVERSDDTGHVLAIVQPGQPVPPPARHTALMVLDGNRDGRLMLFPHDLHVETLADQGALATTCPVCHHQNRPFQKNSGCYECHADMYSVSDTFDHSLHVAKLDGNRGCSRCHQNPEGAKTRRTATSCMDCHENMLVEGSRVPPPEDGLTGLAPGYMQAMHSLCIDCHEERADEHPDAFPESFTDCLGCHRDTSNVELHNMAPYLTGRTPHARSREPQPG